VHFYNEKKNVLYMYAFFHLFVRGFLAGHATLLLKCGSDPRCIGQLAGLGLVAAHANRGVGSEKKITPLQLIKGSGPLEDAKGEAAAAPPPPGSATGGEWREGRRKEGKWKKRGKGGAWTPSCKNLATPLHSSRNAAFIVRYCEPRQHSLPLRPSHR
jgi:hypothetical protein